MEYAAAAALVLVLAVRFVAPEVPPPLVSSSGVFLTDEGWWLKNALLHARFGEWANELDHNTVLNTPAYAWIMSVLFRLLGISIEVARGFTIALTTFGILAFYWACRRSLAPPFAAFATLSVAATVTNLAYSRLALPDPVATVFSLVAICIWIRNPRSARACWISLLLGLLSYFTKASYLFSFGTLLLLWSYDVLSLGLERRGRQALRVALPMVAAPGVLVGIQALLRALAPPDWLFFRMYQVGSRALQVRPEADSACAADLGPQLCQLVDVVKSEAYTILEVLPLASGAPVLCLAIPACILLLAATRGVPQTIRILACREVVAFGLWLVAGVGALGLFRYHPPRYFYFSLFPLAFLALFPISRLQRWGGVAAAIVVALHVAWQVPHFSGWLGRAEASSMALMAREVAERTRSDSEPPVVILGDGFAAFVALYGDHLRPIDLGFVSREHYTICDRIGHWRPQYVLVDEARYESYIGPILDECTELDVELERLEARRLLDGYAGQGDTLFFRMRYSDPQGGSREGPT